MGDMQLLDIQPFDVIWVSRSAIGDFEVFSDSLVESLSRYTRLGLDGRFLLNPDNYIRR